MSISVNRGFSILKNFFTTLLFSFLSLVAWAQTPTHIPREQIEPVDFFESTENIVFYIVIPIVIIALYIFWRRSLRKKRDEEQENK